MAKDLTHEEWRKQKPCPDCNGREGRNPETGIEVRDGHTYNCATRMTPVPTRRARQAEQ